MKTTDTLNKTSVRPKKTVKPTSSQEASGSPKASKPEAPKPSSSFRGDSTHISTTPSSEKTNPEEERGISKMLSSLKGAVSDALNSVSNNQPTPKETPKLTEDLSAIPEAREQYDNLSPSQQADFISLHEASSEAGRFSKNSPNTSENLMNLLSSETLTREDSQGNTLLSNLSEIQNQEFAEEDGVKLDGNAILSDVINQTADPGLIQQNNKGTCTTTTIEYLQASEDPAEYARVIGGLTSSEGQVTLAGGETITRDKNLVAPDDSNRTDASRIYQATMMELGNGEENYRNDRDRHYQSVDSYHTFSIEADAGGGLNSRETEHVAEQVFDRNFDVQTGPRRGGGDEWQENINNALSEEKMVKVSLGWGQESDDKHSNHALSVHGMDDDYVYLRNPWGSGERGKLENDASSSGPVRTTLPPGTEVALPDGLTLDVDTGMFRVEREAFGERLNSYTIG